MCQNEFEYFLLEMHDKIIHNPKICLELQYRCKHNIKQQLFFVLLRSLLLYCCQSNNCRTATHALQYCLWRIKQNSFHNVITMVDLIKTIRIECTRAAKPRLASLMRLFELSEKLYFYLYILQSVEILLSGTVVSDGFTHRSWPRAPRFWGPAQLLPMTIHY